MRRGLINKFIFGLPAQEKLHIVLMFIPALMLVNILTTAAQDPHLPPTNLGITILNVNKHTIRPNQIIYSTLALNIIIMSVRIITALIMLLVIYMGLKQGIAMLVAKPEAVRIFQSSGFSSVADQLFGILTILSAILIIFPQSYVLGNVLMGAGIFVILCLQLSVKDLRRAAIEAPFLLLNLLLLYFQYPLPKQK